MFYTMTMLDHDERMVITQGLLFIKIFDSV